MTTSDAPEPDNRPRVWFQVTVQAAIIGDPARLRDAELDRMAMVDVDGQPGLRDSWPGVHDPVFQCAGVVMTLT